jgi:hypothetical protein
VGADAAANEIGHAGIDINSASPKLASIHFASHEVWARMQGYTQLVWTYAQRFDRVTYENLQRITAPLKHLLAVILASQVMAWSTKAVVWVCGYFLSGDWSTWYAWVLAASYSVGRNLVRCLGGFYREFKSVALSWLAATLGLICLSAFLEWLVDTMDAVPHRRTGVYAMTLHALTGLGGSCNLLLVVLALPVSVPVVLPTLAWKHRLLLGAFFRDWVLVFFEILQWFWSIVAHSLGATILNDIYHGAVWVIMEIVVPSLALPPKIFACGTLVFTGVWVGFWATVASLAAAIWWPFSIALPIVARAFIYCKGAPEVIGGVIFKWFTG